MGRVPPKLRLLMYPTLHGTAYSTSNHELNMFQAPRLCNPTAKCNTSNISAPSTASSSNRRRLPSSRKRPLAAKPLQIRCMRVARRIALSRATCLAHLNNRACCYDMPRQFVLRALWCCPASAQTNNKQEQNKRPIILGWWHPPTDKRILINSARCSR